MIGMGYRVKLKPKAEKELEQIPHHYRERIKKALYGLGTNPYVGKKLIGKYTAYFSFRVWPYRIIYRIYQQELLILVIRIGHRPRSLLRIV